MKESPILFSGEMVKAILEGRKTQTRRVVKFKAIHEGLNFAFTGLEAGYYATDVPSSGWVLRSRRGDGCWEDKTHRVFCPYGQPGDRLWVRETWSYSIHALAAMKDEDGPFVYKAGSWGEDERIDGVWHPSIFMPRFASRITLEIVNVRVERLQHISEEDAEAEGLVYFGETLTEPTPREKFQKLWNSINAKRGYGWDANPWVWVVEFKRKD